MTPQDGDSFTTDMAVPAPRRKSVKKARSELSDTESDYQGKTQTSGDDNTQSGASSQQTSGQTSNADNAAASSSEDNSPPQVAPTSRRGSLRQKAEEEWQSLAEFNDLPLHIFRLAGIYGPGRSPLERVADGAAYRVDAPGHWFSRIHVDDIVRAVLAGFDAPAGAYNIADDRPAPQADLRTAP